MQQRVVLTAALACLLVGVVALIGTSQYENTELLQTQMLKTRHYSPPNPFEDPELRAPYKFDKADVLGDIKTAYKKSTADIKKSQAIVKKVIKLLKAQDNARDKLMDKANSLHGQIKSIRHLLIMVKPEVHHIQNTEDGNWIFKNPFGRSHDPPRQVLAPFAKQVATLKKKTKAYDKAVKAQIKKCRAQRMKALLLNQKLYGAIHKAKAIKKEAVFRVKVMLDKIEMLNRRDYEVVFKVANKMNNKFRIERHRMRGYFNTAKDMSARQPNEVSEITNILTDLLLVSAETQERIQRMDNLISSVKYERKHRYGKKSSKK
jgi:hypothetical protein